MRLNGSDYDEIENTVLEMFEDLGYTRFPVDVFDLAKKLGITLVKYSEFSEEEEWIRSKYEDGYSIYYEPCGYRVYYNDSMPEDRIQFTIWYEIAHIQQGHLYEDIEKTQTRMQAECNKFATFAQTGGFSFLYYKGVECAQDIMDICGISWESANYVLENYMRIKICYPATFAKILSKSRFFEIFTSFSMEESA